MAKVKVWFDSQNASVFSKRVLNLKNKFDKAVDAYVKKNTNMQIKIKKKGIIFGTNTVSWNALTFKARVGQNFFDAKPKENKPLDQTLEKLEENKLLLIHIEGPVFDVIRSELKQMIKDINNLENFLISQQRMKKAA
ncbi:hypothetical protein HN840_05110 [archaeon]|jgi:hypothetical protein|nr:hypothetical protein [archaeon]MBT3731218.1 hypothetical protein [archaeon]MBT4670028.1 hypothetical protein [archaeon]MBT5287770.1 hypothetical protein [archaeon]MBT7052775.1 hypothetical protein [archaeon]